MKVPQLITESYLSKWKTNSFLSAMLWAAMGLVLIVIRDPGALFNLLSVRTHSVDTRNTAFISLHHRRRKAYLFDIFFNKWDSDKFFRNLGIDLTTRSGTGYSQCYSLCDLITWHKGYCFIETHSLFRKT